MGEFLEERLAVGIRFGGSYADDYNVEITTTAGGQEYRKLVHPYPVRSFQIGYRKLKAEIYTDIVNLYHRAYGKYSGFRAKALDDYTTNGLVTAPTNADQTLLLVSTGVYQLIKEYGTDKTALSIGHPYRIIYKPVASTTLVAVQAVSVPETVMWSVSTTTGKVTFAADKTFSITAITKASQAVITVGSHTLIVGESVHISGVSGMTEINTLRGTITAISATTITVNINSTGFTTYTSGGVVHTRPQSGEAVTGGCEFDIPVRFNNAIDIEQNSPNVRDIGNVELIELLNP